MSLDALTRILGQYLSILGYKIKAQKSMVWGLNISKEVEAQVQSITGAIWQYDNVKYLGIKISLDLTCLVT